MKNFIVFALFILCYYSAKADTFIVTSSADNEYGSLREMITAANANGNAVTDYINFNIPQTVFNLRIINLIYRLESSFFLLS